MIGVEEIYNQIIEQGYTWCSVLQGNRKKLLITNREGVVNTPDMCKQKLKKYFDNNPGIYTINLKVRPNDPAKNSIFYDNVNVNSFSAEPHHKASIHEPVDVSKLEKELRAKIAKENAEKEKLARITEKEKQLDQELAALQTFSGRVSAFFKIMTTNVMQPDTANLQGTNTMSDTTKAGYQLFNDARDPQDFTDQERRFINDAFVEIMHRMSPETFIAFSAKVKKDPSIVNTLKALL
jgi:hypothetical protein